jgi:predicted phosphodiesterase
MKIGLVSDVHLEFGDLDLPNKENVDTLILGGDICVAAKLPQFLSFFERVSAEFPNVIYIMGNHEHYKGNFDQTEGILRAGLQKFSNVHLLEKQSKKIDDVVFMGGTLWTDFNKFDSLSMWHCRQAMNDYHIIRMASKGYRKLLPEDTLLEHQKTIDFLNTTLSEHKDEKVVVVGHHAPSTLSVKPRYENDHLTNGAFRSDLSEFILNNPQIKLWTHGHTHSPFDYMVGTTRIVCNPRGYWNYEIFVPGYTYQLLEI